MHQVNNEALVAEYGPLVRQVAYHLKYRLPRSVEQADLEQAGMIGLITAAPRFRAESAATFKTFIWPRVMGAMIDSLREGDWVPRSVAKAGRDLTKAIHDIETAEQRPARECEIAERMGLSPTAYRRMLLDTSRQHVFSSDEYEEQTHGVTEGLTSNSPRPDEALEQEGFEDALHQAMAKLPERERAVIEMTNEGLTLGEAGKALGGITESRTCQLRTQAVARLRAKLADWK